MSASKWAEFPQLGFDVETTGVNVWEDRIVTAALVAIPANGTHPPRITNYLLNPGIDIPEEATAVHGITTAHATEHGVDPAQAIWEIVGTLALAMERGFPVVAVNASFDLTMLEVEARRHGVEGLVARRGGSRKLGPVVDPQVLDKKADPYRKVKGGCKCGCGAEDKTLTGLCLHYRVNLDDAHTADADALAGCLLWSKILDRHPKVFRGHSIKSLHDSQIMWSAEQRNSLRAYFDKAGIEHDGVPLGWPLLNPPQNALEGLAS